MGYKFGNIDIDNQYDGIRTLYYKGTAVSGKLFFRDPQADNPYNLDADESSYHHLDPDDDESLIDFISKGCEVSNSSYGNGSNVIGDTLVTPYYVPYLKNNYYLLVGDNRSYCISGIGLESYSRGSDNDLVWCGRIAISGPGTLTSSSSHPGFINDNYQLVWVLRNQNGQYYEHEQSSGGYDWRTGDEIENVYEFNMSGRSIYIFFPSETICELKMCLQRKDNNKRSPWVGFKINTGQYNDSDGYWAPTIDLINTESDSSCTSPYIHYQRKIWDEFTPGERYSMLPFYGLGLVSDSEINWDPNPFSQS